MNFNSKRIQELEAEIAALETKKSALEETIRITQDQELKGIFQEELEDIIEDIDTKTEDKERLENQGKPTTNGHHPEEEEGNDIRQDAEDFENPDDFPEQSEN